VTHVKVNSKHTKQLLCPGGIWTCLRKNASLTNPANQSWATGVAPVLSNPLAPRVYLWPLKLYGTIEHIPSPELSLVGRNGVLASHQR